jgi:hypothetical protein
MERAKMGPSKSKFELLSPEDRALYRRWWRNGLLSYGLVVALLMFAVFTSQIFTKERARLASNALNTVEISVQK